MVAGWCRAVQCRVGVRGCRGCRSVRTCVRLQVLSVLSGCRVVGFRVLSGGVGLSGLCRGEQPYFVVSGLHQGLTKREARSERQLREHGQHDGRPPVRGGRHTTPLQLGAPTS